MTVIREIPIEQIRPGSNQARRVFDDAGIDELAASLASSGMVQPIVLRTIDGGFELLAGERRWRAAQRAGMHRVPAIVRDDLDAVDAQILGLVENLQRESLRPMETAAGLRRLADLLGLTHDEVGRRVGKSRVYVTNFLRLLTLCDAVAAEVDAGTLSMGHARCLVGLDADVQQRLARECVQQNWSVRQLERAAGKARGPATRPSPPRPVEWQRLERALGEHLACPVRVEADSKGSGELRLRFFSLDELDGLLERVGYRE